LAADRDPRADVQPRMHRRRDLAADVVEVDVHAVRARRLHSGADVAGLVVDRLVEAVELAKILELFRAARDPDRPAARDTGDLARDRADRAGCRGDDDG